MELRLSTISEQSDDIRDSEEFMDSDLGATKEVHSSCRPQKVKKSVRFHPKTQLRTFSKATTSERVNIWLSREELYEIRKECLFTVQCLSLDNMRFFLDDADYQICGRGLENETPAGEKRRALAKAQSRKAVLDEQWLQWYGGIHDDEAIAEEYASFAKSSQRLARIWGLKDERDAREEA